MKRLVCLCIDILFLFCFLCGCGGEASPSKTVSDEELVKEFLNDMSKAFESADTDCDISDDGKTGTIYVWARGEALYWHTNSKETQDLVDNCLEITKLYHQQSNGNCSFGIAIIDSVYEEALIYAVDGEDETWMLELAIRSSS